MRNARTVGRRQQHRAEDVGDLDVGQIAHVGQFDGPAEGFVGKDKTHAIVVEPAAVVVAAFRIGGEAAQYDGIARIAQVVDDQAVVAVIAVGDVVAHVQVVHVAPGQAHVGQSHRLIRIGLQIEDHEPEKGRVGAGRIKPALPFIDEDVVRPSEESSGLVDLDHRIGKRTQIEDLQAFVAVVAYCIGPVAISFEIAPGGRRSPCEAIDLQRLGGVEQVEEMHIGGGSDKRIFPPVAIYPAPAVIEGIRKGAWQVVVVPIGQLGHIPALLGGKGPTR